MSQTADLRTAYLTACKAINYTRQGLHSQQVAAEALAAYETAVAADEAAGIVEMTPHQARVAAHQAKMAASGLAPALTVAAASPVGVPVVQAKRTPALNAWGGVARSIDAQMSENAY